MTIPPSADSSPPPASTDSWRERLVRSKYYRPGEFAVRLGKKNTQWDRDITFPLGTLDENEAVARAMALHRDLRSHGWDWVRSNRPREFILAFFWNQNPSFATYTTLCTGAAAVEAPQDRPFSALIVEPDEAQRHALVNWLSALPGWRCHTVLPDLAAALAATEKGDATLALCNCGAFGSPGQFPAMLAELSKRIPAVPFVTVNHSDSLFLQVFEATHGYQFKRTTPEDLLAPLRGIEKNPEAWTSAARRYSASLWRDAPSWSSAIDSSKSQNLITHREAEILQGIAEGLLNKEIAARLAISPNTVHNHICNIFKKLGVGTRTEAAAWYFSR